MLLRYFSRNMIWCSVVGLLACAVFAFVFGAGEVFAEGSYHLVVPFKGAINCIHLGTNNNCTISSELEEYLGEGSWNNGWSEDVNLYADVESDYFDKVTNYYMARWHPQDGMKLRDRKVFTKNFTISDAVVKQKGKKKDDSTLGVTTYTLNACYVLKVHFGSVSASGVGSLKGCTNVYVNEYWGVLSIVGKNIYNNSKIIENGVNLGGQTVRKNSAAQVDYADLWTGRSKRYKFIGWKKDEVDGLTGLITNTSGAQYYVENPVGLYDNGNKNIYGRLNVLDMALGVSKTFYAYYAPPCYVKKVDEGIGTHIKLERKSSKYATVGELTGSKYLYYGDQLQITFELDDGYTWEYRKVNRKNYDSDIVMYAVGVSSNGACSNVSIEAKAVEDSSSSENTEALIEIKKEEQDEYTEEDIYVKPGDKLKYRVSYDPGAQTEAFSVPSAMKVNEELISNDDGLSMVDLFNRSSGVGEWANYFNIWSSDNMSPLRFTDEEDGAGQCNGAGHRYKCSYDVGDYEARQVVNEHVVQIDEVGGVLKEEVVINSEEDETVNPSSIRKNENTSEVFTNLITDNVRAMVPYNFKNLVEISKDSTKDYAFAGETFSASYNITTVKRYNEMVGGGEYATIVRGAKWKAGVCTDKEDINTCDWYDEKDGDLNTGGKLDGALENKSTSVIVPDLPAGTEIYVRAAVYPAESSDSETGWADPDGNHEWAYSEPVAVSVAKKPSFQVWGGDVFVENEVNVPLADKKKMADPVSVKAPRRFGSWGELSVEIGSGGNRGNLFSGAALGFAGNNDGKLSPNYSFPLEGGSTSGYQGLGNNELNIGDPGGRAINDTNSDNKGDLNYSGGSMINIGALVNKLDGKVKVTNEGVEMVGADIPDMESGDSIMYKNDSGTITINGDIKYSGSYNTIDSIPKVIIYADNIIINCNIERIDAVLIANENIETCPFAEGDEKKNNLGSPARSVQLRINGAVIAGSSVSFDRSYGAGTGANSMIPAEIINMDPSWYLWAAGVKAMNTSTSSSASDGLMVPTYIRELPPRY